MNETNFRIRESINRFDLEGARVLLREALKNPNEETYYLASMAAVNDWQREEYLRKALELDPFHEEAYLELERLRAGDAGGTQGTLVPSPSRSRATLEVAEELDIDTLNTRIREGIDRFELAEAQALLEVALKKPTAETHYLASLVAEDDSHRDEHLQKALELDPFHGEAFTALEETQQGSFEHGDPVPATPPRARATETRQRAPAKGKRLGSIPRIPRLALVASVIVVIILAVAFLLGLGIDGRGADKTIQVHSERDLIVDEDGLPSVYMPSGAVERDTKLHIEAVDSYPNWSDSRPVGQAFDVTLEDGVLGDSIEVGLPVDLQNIDLESGRLFVAYHDEDVGWVEVPSWLSEEGTELRFTLDHLTLLAPMFSRFFGAPRITSLQISPNPIVDVDWPPCFKDDLFIAVEVDDPNDRVEKVEASLEFELLVDAFGQQSAKFKDALIGATAAVLVGDAASVATAVGYPGAAQFLLSDVLPKSQELDLAVEGKERAVSSSWFSLREDWRVDGLYAFGLPLAKMSVCDHGNFDVDDAMQGAQLKGLDVVVRVTESSGRTIEKQVTTQYFSGRPAYATLSSPGPTYSDIQTSKPVFRWQLENPARAGAQRLIYARGENLWDRWWGVKKVKIDDGTTYDHTPSSELKPGKYVWGVEVAPNYRFDPDKTVRSSVWGFTVGSRAHATLTVDGTRVTRSEVEHSDKSSFHWSVVGLNGEGECGPKLASERSSYDLVSDLGCKPGSYEVVLQTYENRRRMPISEPVSVVVGEAGGSQPEDSTLPEQTQWEILLPGVRATAVAVSPDSTILFASAYDEGLYRSTDGGKSWQLIGTSHDFSYTQAIDIDPENPDRTVLHSGGALYLSQDGGDTWERKTDEGANHPGVLMRSLADPDRLYAELNGRRWFRSDDGGETWDQIADLSKNHSKFITIDPVDSDHVFTSVFQQGLFESKDGADSWQQFGIWGDSDEITYLTYSVHKQKLIYACSDEGDSAFSNDGGQSWDRWERVRACGEIAFHPKLATVVFMIASDSGGPVFRSEDSGTTWGEFYGGTSHDMAITESPPYRLVVADDSGVNAVYLSEH